MSGDSFVHALLHWSLVACFVHLIAVNVLFFVLLLFAAFENVLRSREGHSEDYDALSTSRFTIPVSIVGPVFNEEVVVLPAVRSLLAIDYPELEVIVVNDGSTDATLELLKREFDLKPREVFYRRVLPSREVRAVYRSERDHRLIVVDKVNGGKADALNCGINLARYRYLCCVDGDTVYTPDALLKGMRLAVKDPGTVIGVTSHVAISTHPEQDERAEPGTKTLDTNILSNFQHIDYLRAFINNRLAWSRLDFMLCSVGAFAIWRRDVVLEVGGFSRDFTCEDIELTFRIHEKYLREKKPFRILSLPDTVGKTEGPDRLGRLISQRARWQRVIMETVWHYRHMFANPRYRTVGLIGVPYYLVSEVLAPFFEVLALAALPIAAWLGVLSLRDFLLFVGIISFTNGIFTSAAIVLQDQGARDYRLRDLVRLVLLGPAEMVFYRPWLSVARLKGAWGFLRGDKRWHKFQRNSRTAHA